MDLKASQLQNITESTANKRGRLLLLFARRLWRLLPTPVRFRFWAWWGSIFPYQRITYKGRVLAWGRDRTATFVLLFPAAPVGESILDVGCHTGFYCFEAASRGAKYCLGIDIDRGRIAKGRALIKKERIRDIDLVAADVRQYDFYRPFDTVLCLNLLQHMTTIDKVEILLTRLDRVAQERLILIVPVTTTPHLVYEHALRDNIPYLLLSEEYFGRRYGSGIHVVHLPHSCYGPNRIAVTVTKPNTCRTPSLPEYPVR